MFQIHISEFDFGSIIWLNWVVGHVVYQSEQLAKQFWDSKANKNAKDPFLNGVFQKLMKWYYVQIFDWKLYFATLGIKSVKWYPTI